tara:strand:- start:787 stop:1029 length:243 start_codon:yes stop_codon:yes gene_type:complete
MLLKVKGTATDIASTPTDLDNATVCSVVNIHTAAVLIALGGGATLYIAAGERVLIEKLPNETIDAPGHSATEIWATSVGY